MPISMQAAIGVMVVNVIIVCITAIRVSSHYLRLHRGDRQKTIVQLRKQVAKCLADGGKEEGNALLGVDTLLRDKELSRLTKRIFRASDHKRVGALMSICIPALERMTAS